MLRAILFDMGGTLDGDGVDWLNRFQGLYAEADAALEWHAVRAAFDHAEQRSSADDKMCSAGLDGMLFRHVGWQLEYLRVSDPGLQRRIASDFGDAVRRLAGRHLEVLAKLHARGLQLGVVSNGCGNVEVLCRELGYSAWLAVVVDSKRVGVAKPDPAIFELAAARLGVAPR